MRWFRRYSSRRYSSRQVAPAKSLIQGRLVDTEGLPIGEGERIVAFHATSQEHADRLLSDGFTPGAKPQRTPTIIKDESVARMLGKDIGDVLDYEPGRGLGSGLYVGPDPVRLAGVFGDVVLRIDIRAEDLSSPPERAKVSPLKAFLLNDGYIEKPIPAESFSLA